MSATSSLMTSGGIITFARLSGKPSQSGMVYVRSNTGTTSILIHASGLIEYQ